jgi:Phage terminase large subunit (GpA)
MTSDLLNPLQADIELIQMLERTVAGAPISMSDLRRVLERFDFDTVLPCVLKLKGKAMNVAERRPMFRPLFARKRKAKKEIYICGRQIGKTASEAAAALMNLIFRERFEVLYVAPQAIYTQKFHSSYMADMIASHMLPWDIQTSSSVSNVNSKTFTSGSKFLAASMFSNPNNVLGTTADWVIVDELQGLDYDLLPYALETLGTSEFRWETYLGTARGIENTIQSVFEMSSMSMWHMRCDYCGHVNVPTFEESCRMIQKAGIGCSVCSTDARPKLLNVDKGWWVSQYPDRESTFMGYHVPQIIVRDRIEPYDRYFDTIYTKLKGSTMYSPARFQQEILGISSEQGGRPITPDQLRAACCLDISEGHPAPIGEYTHIAGGADWGGSEITSFTVGTAVGRHHTGDITFLVPCVLWVFQWMSSTYPSQRRSCGWPVID